MRNNLIFICTALMLAIGNAQAQPLFGGPDSESSIKLSNNSAASINAKDKSVTLNFTHHQQNANAFERLTLKIKTKGNNNIGSILTKGDISPETSLKLSIANRINYNKNLNSAFPDIIKQIPKSHQNSSYFKKFITAYKASKDSTDIFSNILILLSEENISQAHADSIDAMFYQASNAVNIDKIKYIASGLWLIFDGGFSVGQYKSFDSSKSFSDQITNKTYNGWEGKIGINGWMGNSARFKSRILYGVTLGLKQTNNISKLAQKTVEETQAHQGVASTRTIKTSTTAYEGTFEESTEYPLNIDWILAPNRSPNLAIDFYTRMDLKKSQGDEWKTSFGVGLFLLKENNPLQHTGGITFEIDDAFDADDTGKSLKDKFKINVLVGFVLPFSGS